MNVVHESMGEIAGGYKNAAASSKGSCEILSKLALPYVKGNCAQLKGSKSNK